MKVIHVLIVILLIGILSVAGYSLYQNLTNSEDNLSETERNEIQKMIDSPIATESATVAATPSAVKKN